MDNELWYPEYISFLSITNGNNKYKISAQLATLYLRTPQATKGIEINHLRQGVGVVVVKRQPLIIDCVKFQLGPDLSLGVQKHHTNCLLCPKLLGRIFQTVC